MEWEETHHSGLEVFEKTFRGRPRNEAYEECVPVGGYEVWRRRRGAEEEVTLHEDIEERGDVLGTTTTTTAAADICAGSPNRWK
jgi:hypothetical protein